jgi:PIN domain nuclease of toxin-antitoxin system
MTRLLLDTSVVIWLSDNQPRIDRIKDLIFSQDAEVFISAVSWWEMAIKSRSGRLQADVAKLRFLAEEHGFRELPLYGKAMEAMIGVPKFHNDPFDYMLFAQAMTESMQFITGDTLLADYSSLVMAI